MVAGSRQIGDFPRQEKWSGYVQIFGRTSSRQGAEEGLLSATVDIRKASKSVKD